MLTPTFLLRPWLVMAVVLPALGWANDATAAITDDLVAYWNFDEGSGATAGDTSGAVNDDGTLTGGSGPIWTTGKVNGGLDFDGVDDRVFVPISTDLDPSSSNGLSISVWVNPDALTSMHWIVSTLHTSGYYLRADFRGLYPNDQISFSARGWLGTEGQPYLSTGTWTHLAGTYETSTSISTLYADGCIIARGQVCFPAGCAPWAPAVDLTIGSWFEGAEVFDGRIDEVYIHDRAITTAEVQQLAGTASCPNPPPPGLFFPLDPNDTYLHVEASDVAGDAVVIDLAALGISPGVTIELTQTGDFDGDGVGGAGETQTSLSAVFSSSDVLLPKSNLNRVQDAIDAGTDIVTAVTCDGANEPTDISEDFRIGGPGATVLPPLQIVVPFGATHLFAAAPDCLYADNADTDGDFGLVIKLLPATLNALAAHDKPGPVRARVQGWDATCTPLFNSVLEWPDDNNTYGTKSLTSTPAPTTVRFTFINDSFGGGGQDTDRNLFLDEWNIDGGSPTQGEKFTRSFGPDPSFPGCDKTTIFGAMVTGCGNQDDWAEYGPPCPESSCTDSVDNNGDGLTDCQDSGCCTAATCDGVGFCELGTEQSCNDGQDNDGDGDIDCADVDCTGIGTCEFSTELTCNDSIDNDGDQDTDCQDSDCDGVGTCEFPEQTCDDSIDNDDDGFTDCDDTDCQGVDGCPEIRCNDSVDNDSDGDIDCADADCDGVGGCEFGTELTCNDGLDNDGDSDIDCLDADCAGMAPCEPFEVSCDDGFDNDGDSDIDCLDADCDGISGCEVGTELSCGDGIDNDADGAADCSDLDCAGVAPCEPFEVSCDDGFDNDGDGATDCADSGCQGVNTCTNVTFSIDFQGWLVSLGYFEGFFFSTFITEGDVLTPGDLGPPGPNPAGFGFFEPGLEIAPDPGSPFGVVPGGLGILPGFEGFVEVDALSYGWDALGRLFFSVDEFAIGVPGPSPPDVASEASLGVEEASADVFEFLGSVAPTPPGPVLGNTAFIDGDGSFVLPGLGLFEPNPPTFGLPDDGDNLDALDLETSLAHLGGPIFFSLDSWIPDFLEPGPPVNTGTGPGNGFSGADVLVTPAPGAPPGIYADALDLGLDISGPDTDDLDALFLQSDGDLIFTPGDIFASPGSCGTPGFDCILFSVRRASLVIGTPDSAFGAPIEEGDILTNPLISGDPPRIFIAAEALGLETLRSFGGQPWADDLDALDVMPVPEPSTASIAVIGARGLTAISSVHPLCWDGVIGQLNSHSDLAQ